MTNKDITFNSNILVVDDSLFILKATQLILKDKYNVWTAQSAEIAYNMMERDVPDLILLDLEMPGINGYDFIKKVKATQEWQNIPVIFLTGTDDRKKEEHALNMGAVDYILKPIVEGVLLNRIRLHLELSLFQKSLEDMVASRTEELFSTQEELRKAAETAKEALRAKTAFLANMSHEIRTPMNSIMGFTELALSDDIPANTRDYLQKIKTGAEGLLEIINDILDVSKIESGKLTLENIPFDLSDVFKNCQALTQLKAAERGVVLFCYTESFIGRKLVGDPTKLRQVLLNLLSNAIKFTSRGIVKMLSSVTNSTEDRITIRFEIKDSGIGMSPEQLNRLFIPFEQADSSTTRKYGGTGLGLSITKNIVELMGGKLEVESVLDVGSKFSFELTFDFLEADSIEDINENMKDIVEKPMFNGNILICEDNQMNQQVICDHLARVGFRTVVTENGQEAVECVRERMNLNEEQFDLIFMDIHMPVMDGMEATQKLVELGVTSPIVALTANIMPHDKILYKQVGMVGYLSKPFSAQELWRCLLRHLTPLPANTVKENETSSADKTLGNKLLVIFWEENQKTMENITSALRADDIKSAHGYVHTLKSVAALIEKDELKKAAADVEYSLKERSKATKEQLTALEFELNAVMCDLELKVKELSRDKSINKKNYGSFSKSKALELIKELEPKIKTGDLDCLDSIELLHDIPGTDTLIHQIEQLEFELARETIAGIKHILENDISEG